MQAYQCSSEVRLTGDVRHSTYFGQEARSSATTGQTGGD